MRFTISLTPDQLASIRFALAVAILGEHDHSPAMASRMDRALEALPRADHVALTLVSGGRG